MNVMRRNSSRMGRNRFLRAACASPRARSYALEVIMDETDRLSEFRRMLRDELGSQRYDVWFGDVVEVQCRDHALRLTCPSSRRNGVVEEASAPTNSRNAFRAVWGDLGSQYLSTW